MARQSMLHLLPPISGPIRLMARSVAFQGHLLWTSRLIRHHLSRPSIQVHPEVNVLAVQPHPPHPPMAARVVEDAHPRYPSDTTLIQRGSSVHIQAKLPHNVDAGRDVLRRLRTSAIRMSCPCILLKDQIRKERPLY